MSWTLQGQQNRRSGDRVSCPVFIQVRLFLLNTACTAKFFFEKMWDEQCSFWKHLLTQHLLHLQHCQICASKIVQVPTPHTKVAWKIEQKESWILNNFTSWCQCQFSCCKILWAQKQCDEKLRLQTRFKAGHIGTVVMRSKSVLILSQRNYWFVYFESALTLT